MYKPYRHDNTAKFTNYNQFTEKFLSRHTFLPRFCMLFCLVQIKSLIGVDPLLNYLRQFGNSELISNMEQSATYSRSPGETSHAKLRYTRVFIVIALATCMKAMERSNWDSRYDEIRRFPISASFYINLQPALKLINQLQKLFRHECYHVFYHYQH